VTLTTRNYLYTSFSFGTWLSNLHVETRNQFENFLVASVPMDEPPMDHDVRIFCQNAE